MEKKQEQSREIIGWLLCKASLVVCNWCHPLNLDFSLPP